VGKRNRERGGPGIVLWLVLGGVLAALVLCGGGGLAVALWAYSAKGGGVTTERKGLPTRDEFRQSLMGKTKDEVMGIAGRPKSTQEGRDGNDTWVYHDRTVDPMSGKTDVWAFVAFTDGKVTRVSY
jgi:hypothetical protein